MKRLTAASRITIGLVCSMLGILLSANFLGILPDQDQLIVQSRIQLAEMTAMNVSILVSEKRFSSLDALLPSIVERHPQLKSIGVRDASGELHAASTGHPSDRPDDSAKGQSDQFMAVPLSAPEVARWGQVEFCFHPLRSAGLLSVLERPFVQLLIFAAAAGFFGFRIFLRTVLKNLDPSRAVPRRVREALDILTEGLMIVGLDDRVLLANSALAQTVGGSAESLIGQRATEFGFRTRTGDGLMPWTLCLRSESSVSAMIMDYTCKDGTQCIFKVNCSPLIGNEGRLRGVMVSLDDVTQLEQNKVQLNAAREEAEAANRAKSDFLANMSHEIRNPMNAIVGFSDVLRRGLDVSEEVRADYLNTIHASGTHLVELINDILDLSKIEANRMELEITDCLPYQVIQEVVNVLKMKADQQALELKVNVCGKIPEKIHTDPTRLRQILMNLVGNAIKFTAEGRITVSVELLQQPDGPFLQFEVTDTGIGMTPEQCGKMFQQFVQADSSVTRRFGGTGLGLAISKRLTEALGGTIGVESESGVGSTFRFTVRTGDLSEVQLLSNDEARDRYRSAVKTSNDGLNLFFHPARVLITDDTPANRQLVGLVLRKAGLFVDEAENGAVAVEKATSQPYDLLLMDMQMPVMDGFSATKELRSSGLTTPILAFTANVMEQDRQRCASAGCSGFLTKPINIELLLSTIAEFLPVQTSVKSQDSRQSAPVVSRPAAMASVSKPEPRQFGQLTKPAYSLDSLADNLLPMPASIETPRRTAITSSLPMEVPEFREIVAQFISGLPKAMSELRMAWDRGDIECLRELAHRLKGTGGTVGFDVFTEPSRQLQHAAETGNSSRIPELLSELDEIVEAVVLPEQCSLQLN